MAALFKIGSTSTNFETIIPGPEKLSDEGRSFLGEIFVRNPEHRPGAEALLVRSWIAADDSDQELPPRGGAAGATK